jgi:DHA2 family multidrug resistance protein
MATAAPPSSSADTGPPPLTGAPLVISLVFLALANFIAILDLSIANVSLPNISSGLGVSPHEGTWVITSYAVAEALTVPLTGWLAARFGPGRAFIFSLSGFGLSSILCGLSVSFPMLLGFRVLQGLTGGPMIPLSQTLMMNLSPRGRQGAAMGIWSMTSVLGPVAGPVFGGQICDHLSWPWIFFINAPIILVTASICAGIVLHRDPPPQRRPIDFVGLGLMMLWIGAIQIMLDRGEDLDWFDSNIIVGLLIVGIIGFAAFIIWELTDVHPIVNLRVFKNRTFTACTAAICIGFGAYFGSVVITPLWLQTNMGYTSAWAGLANAPPGATVFILSPLVAWFQPKVDARKLISVAMVVFASAFFWRSHFASNVTFPLVLETQALVGSCIACFFGPAMTMAMSSVKPQEIASAAGMISFCRTTALAFSTSLTTTAWTDATVRNRRNLVDQFHESDAISQLSHVGLSPHGALLQLDRMLQDQAVMMATNDTYRYLAIAMIVGGMCIWLAPHGTTAPNVKASH